MGGRFVSGYVVKQGRDVNLKILKKMRTEKAHLQLFGKQ